MGFAQLFTGFADEPRQLSGASRRKKNTVTLNKRAKFRHKMPGVSCP
jgi:hypothetical protein